MPYKELEHTADILIEVTGDSLENLFEEAGKALFDILGKSGTKSVDQTVIQTHASNPEQLLVKWLEELLAEHEISGNLFNKFRVKIQGNQLEAQVFGGPGKVETSIKAVTFHRLKIWEESGKWKARILFDI